MHPNLCSGGVNDVTRVTLFLLLCMPGVNGLRCFTCMSMDCPLEDALNCKRLQALVQWEMRSRYFIGQTTAFCPPLNDTEGWERLQKTEEDDDSCPEPGALCSVGRVQLEITDFDENEIMTGSYYSYATVLGCVNPNTIPRGTQATLCDNIHHNESLCRPVFSQRTISLKHCLDPKDTCNTADYCIDATESVVKPWTQSENEPFSGILLFFVILALLGTGVGIVVIGVLCLKPKTVHADCQSYSSNDVTVTL